MSSSASSSATGPPDTASSSSSSEAAASLATQSRMSGEERLKELEALFVEGPESPAPAVHEAKALSTETLLDILLILYNECCGSSLRKEKTVTEFIELGRNNIEALPLRYFVVER